MEPELGKYVYSNSISTKEWLKMAIKSMLLKYIKSSASQCSYKAEKSIDKSLVLILRTAFCRYLSPTAMKHI